MTKGQIKEAQDTVTRLSHVLGGIGMKYYANIFKPNPPEEKVEMVIKVNEYFRSLGFKV